MKPVRKVLILSAFVFGIIVCWLAPGINKARDVRYTRIYEDTDAKSTVSHTRDSSHEKRKKSAAVSSRKIYKKESIRANSKFSDLKPSMFSRAIQYSEEVKIVELDTVNNVQLLTIDTVASEPSIVSTKP